MKTNINVCSLDGTDHVRFCSIRSMLDEEMPKHECEHFAECHQIKIHVIPLYNYNTDQIPEYY